MRTLLWLIVGAGSCGIWAQQAPRSTPKRPHPVWFSSRLKASTQAELGRRLNSPFPEGAEHPAGVNNCAEWLAKGTGAVGGEAAGPDAQAQKTSLAECLVLRALRDATAARLSSVADLKWDEGALAVLPPELAINVSDESIGAAKAASVRGQSWAELDRGAAASAGGQDQILVKGDGFSEKLILWGRGDFDRDGRQDLLVQTLDTLTEGSYRNIRLFVLTRKTAKARLSVVKELL